MTSIPKNGEVTEYSAMEYHPTGGERLMIWKDIPNIKTGQQKFKR